MSICPILSGAYGSSNAKEYFAEKRKSVIFMGILIKIETY